MRIVFFGNAPDKIAAIRYRIETFARMLERDGHRCVVCLPSSTPTKERLWERGGRAGKLLYLVVVLFRRIAQLRHVPGADVVFFRGPVFPYAPPWFERIIHAINPRMVFDIDDAVWEKPAYVDSPFLRLVDFRWTHKMCALCVHAIVGNQHLADFVRPMLPHITVVPTCVDMEKHTGKDWATRKDSAVVLGWTGVKDNLGYMRMIEPVLQELAERYPIRIHVATGRAYALDGVEVENHFWRLDGEIEYLQAADIGLMPLEDTPRARGKCAFKAIQYMAVGVPPVISPVGMNASVLEDGVEGFLANSPEEWREKLDVLIRDPHRRQAMGQAARARAEREYSHSANYPAFLAALERVAASKRRSMEKREAGDPI